MYPFDITDDCTCTEKDLNSPYKLATAYIPNQCYPGILSPREGFKRGSMFPNLYQPYKRTNKKQCKC